MNQYEILGLVLLGVAVVIGIVYVVVPLAIKKGLKVDGFLQTADKDIDIIKGAVDTVGKIAPIPYLDLIDRILVYADKAVAEAEQLYKIGQVKVDDRKTEAKNYLLHLLNIANIQVTPDLEKVIDGAIEAGVYILPKTGLMQSQDVPTPTVQDVQPQTNEVKPIDSQLVSQEVQDTIAELHSGDSAPDLTKEQPQA